MVNTLWAATLVTPRTLGSLFSNGGALDPLCAECGGDGDLEFLLFCKPLAQGDRVVAQRKPFM